MALDEARELLTVQAEIDSNGNHYNYNGSKNILGAV